MNIPQAAVGRPARSSVRHRDTVPKRCIVGDDQGRAPCTKCDGVVRKTLAIGGVENRFNRSACICDPWQRRVPTLILPGKALGNIGIIAGEENQVTVISRVAIIKNNHQRSAVGVATRTIGEPSYRVRSITRNKWRHIGFKGAT